MGRHGSIDVGEQRRHFMLLTTASTVLVALCLGLGSARLAHAAAGDDVLPARASVNDAAADPGRKADTAHAPVRHQVASPLDRRLVLLAKELDLDAAQQAKLRTLLLDQAAQVGRVWNDASVPAPVRVQLTQKIGDRTAEQIRALLNDDQRKKYSKPVDRNAARGGERPDVEAWIPGKKTM